jgi:impB/mucB/samB family C-terminal domain
MAFIRTSPFRPNDPQHSGCRSIALPAPSSDSAHLVELVTTLVDALQKVESKGSGQLN